MVLSGRRWHLGTGVNYSLNVLCCTILTHLYSLWVHPVAPAVRAANWLFTLEGGCTCGQVWITHWMNFVVSFWLTCSLTGSTLWLLPLGPPWGQRCCYPSCGLCCITLPYLQSLCKSPCGPISTKQRVVERSSWAEGGLQPSSWYSSVMSETIRNVHQEEPLLWQFLLLTKYKTCTGLPLNIMAGYEEDELHCYRSISSRFCLNATYRLNVGLHWLDDDTWGSS